MTETTRLYENKGKRNSRTVDLTVSDDGSIKADAQDVGELPRSMFGDGDYEFWFTITSENVPALCFALLRDKLSGDPGAVDTLRDYCEANGIAGEFGDWM